MEDEGRRLLNSLKVTSSLSLRRPFHVYTEDQQQPLFTGCPPRSLVQSVGLWLHHDVLVSRTSMSVKCVS